MQIIYKVYEVDCLEVSSLSESDSKKLELQI